MEPIGPCPIPNCALEWLCSASLLTLAVFIWAVTPEGNAAHAMSFEHGGQYGWSLTAGLVGLTQIVSLLLKRPALQRWASLLGFFVLISLGSTILSFAAFGLPLFTALVFPLALSEGYIYLLLRGAQWSKSS